MQMKSTKISFKDQNIYVGIDSHLKNWVVTILLEQSIYKTFSMNPSAQELVNYLNKHFPDGNYYSAYEAGFCGFSIHRELEKLGVKSIIVNPADIPTTDKDKKQKEDKRDSRKIAKSLRNGDLIGIYIPTIANCELRGLVRYRKSLVTQIGQRKNRMKSFLYFNGIKIPEQFASASVSWSGKFTSWLETIECQTANGKEVIFNLIKTTNFLRSVLLDINKQFRLLKKNDEYSVSIDNLLSIPGIGLIAAITIISEIGNINRFKKFDQLCSFIGLIPTTNSSGEHEKIGHISNRANKQLRTILIEAAWVAIRYDPALALSFNGYCQRMKKNDAIIRIAKKLLNRIRYVLTNGKKYVLSVV